LEEKGVTYFNANKASWKIRHIWGRFEGLCEEEPGPQLLPAQPHAAEPRDGTVTSPPCPQQTKRAALAPALPPGAGGRRHRPRWKQSCPAAPSSLARVGLAACPGSSAPLQQLKKWKKVGGKHPVYRHRARISCNRASHHTCASLAGRTSWGDGERGAEETPQLLRR